MPPQSPDPPSGDAPQSLPFPRVQVVRRDDRPATPGELRSAVLDALSGSTGAGLRHAFKIHEALVGEQRDIEFNREVVAIIKEAAADDRIAFSDFDSAIKLLCAATTATARDVLEIVARKAPLHLEGHDGWREKALRFIADRVEEFEPAELASIADEMLASESEARVAFGIGLAGTPPVGQAPPASILNRICTLALHPTFQVRWAALWAIERFRDAAGLAAVVTTVSERLRNSATVDHHELYQLARLLDLADALGLLVEPEVIEQCEAGLLVLLRSEEQKTRRRGYHIALETCPLRFSRACDLLVLAAVNERERHAQDHAQAGVSRWRQGILTPPRVDQLRLGVTSLVERAANNLGGLEADEMFWSWQLRNASDLVANFPEQFGVFLVAKYRQTLELVQHSEIEPVLARLRDLEAKLAQVELGET